MPQRLRFPLNHRAARAECRPVIRAASAVATVLLLLPALARADRPAGPPPSNGDLCLPAIAAAERANNLPQHLLRSIAYVESGRVDPATGRAVPWPWAINVGGTGYFYESKEQAIAAVQTFQARGIRSIDVGCAQINLMHHAAAFASLDSAFDPQTNTAYAARFLTDLRRATGSWPMAAAGYHSRTADIGVAYARKVMEIWPGSARYGSLPGPALQTTALGTSLRGGIGAANTTPGLNMDYSVYTPEFAAAVRRMDQDRTGAQGAGQGGKQGRASAQRRGVRQAPMAANGLPARTARQEVGEAPG